MEKKSATEQIADQLRKDIILKKYKLNEHLVEAKISADLGVSITPIRQAYQQLAKEGLLVVYPYRGVCVTNIDDKMIEDIKVVRLMIELEAAKTAYDNMIANDSDCLQNILDQVYNVDENDFYGMLLKDIKFHECIIIHANNRLLVELWKIIASRVMLLQSYSKPTSKFNRERFRMRHKEIAEAVLKKKGKEIFLELHHQNLMEAYSKPEIQVIYNNNNIQTQFNSISDYRESD